MALAVTCLFACGSPHPTGSETSGAVADGEIGEVLFSNGTVLAEWRYRSAGSVPQPVIQAISDLGVLDSVAVFRDRQRSLYRIDDRLWEARNSVIARDDGSIVERRVEVEWTEAPIEIRRAAGKWVTSRRERGQSGDCRMLQVMTASDESWRVETNGSMYSKILLNVGSDEQREATRYRTLEDRE